MAVVLMEGWDHMIASLVTTKNWTINPTTMQTGRLSGQAARLQSNNALLEMLKILPATYATAIFGIAHRENTYSGASFARFKAGATIVAGVRINATSHKLEVVNSAGTVIATGTTLIPLNTWIYVELKIFVNGASGTCELHLNGVSGEIASTTGNFGSTNIDSFSVLSDQNNVAMDYDDAYVVDTTGAAPRNTFLGDVRVETIYPASDGATTQWTPNSGTPHFSRVNENTGTFPDGDTTYVSDATPGDYDLYGVGALSVVTGTVFAVQTNLYARKDDAGARQIAPAIRQAGTTFDGATVTLSTTYQFYPQINNQDPTAADWTIANVNGDQFGVKEVA